MAAAAPKIDLGAIEKGAALKAVEVKPAANGALAQAQLLGNIKKGAALKEVGTPDEAKNLEAVKQAYLDEKKAAEDAPAAE